MQIFVQIKPELSAYTVPITSGTEIMFSCNFSELTIWTCGYFTFCPKKLCYFQCHITAGWIPNHKRFHISKNQAAEWSMWGKAIWGFSGELFFLRVCVCVNSVRCMCVHILKSYVCMHAHMCSTAYVQCMLIHVHFDVHSVMTDHMAVAWL